MALRRLLESFTEKRLVRFSLQRPQCFFNLRVSLFRNASITSGSSSPRPRRAHQSRECARRVGEMTRGCAARVPLAACNRPHRQTQSANSRGRTASTEMNRAHVSYRLTPPRRLAPLPNAHTPTGLRVTLAPVTESFVRSLLQLNSPPSSPAPPKRPSTRLASVTVGCDPSP